MPAVPVLYCACVCFSQEDSYFLQLLWPGCKTSFALRRVAQHWIYALCSWWLGGARLDKGYQGNLGLLEWVLTGLGAGAFVVIWIQLGEIAQLFHQD